MWPGRSWPALIHDHRRHLQDSLSDSWWEGETLPGAQRGNQRAHFRFMKYFYTHYKHTSALMMRHKNRTRDTLSQSHEDRHELISATWSGCEGCEGCPAAHWAALIHGACVNHEYRHFMTAQASDWDLMDPKLRTDPHSESRQHTWWFSRHSSFLQLRTRLTT